MPVVRSSSRVRELRRAASVFGILSANSSDRHLLRSELPPRSRSRGSRFLLFITGFRWKKESSSRPCAARACVVGLGIFGVNGRSKVGTRYFQLLSSRILRDGTTTKQRSPGSVTRRCSSTFSELRFSLTPSSFQESEFDYGDSLSVRSV